MIKGTKKTKTHNRFDSLPLEQRELFAENLKERIYSTITLLAVLAAMWHTAEHHTMRGAIVSIIGAVVALWLATLIAARMSYRAVHGKSIGREAYMRGLFTSSGLLTPAITPVIIVTIGGMTHWYSLQVALMVSMIVSLFTLFILSFNAGRKIYDSVWRQLLISFVEVSVGVGVILLKLAVGE